MLPRKVKPLNIKLRDRQEIAQCKRRICQLLEKLAGYPVIFQVAHPGRNRDKHTDLVVDDSKRVAGARNVKMASSQVRLEN